MKYHRLLRLFLVFVFLTLLSKILLKNKRNTHVSNAKGSLLSNMDEPSQTLINVDRTGCVRFKTLLELPLCNNDGIDYMISHANNCIAENALQQEKVMFHTLVYDDDNVDALVRGFLMSQDLDVSHLNIWVMHPNMEKKLQNSEWMQRYSSYIHLELFDIKDIIKKAQLTSLESAYILRHKEKQDAILLILYLYGGLYLDPHGISFLLNCILCFKSCIDEKFIWIISNWI